MANFDRLAEQGKPIFLRHNQEAILRRLGLHVLDGKIPLRYCGEDYAVDCVSGDVTGPGGLPAGPHEIRVFMKHRVPYTGYFGEYLVLDSDVTEMRDLKEEQQ